MLKQSGALLAFSAGAMAMALAMNTSASAAIDVIAVEVVEQQYETQLQSLEVSPAAQQIAPERDAFVVETVSVIQWPVSDHSVTDGFGYRVAPCWGCSTDHKGVDFTPGYGTPVEVIADGVVTQAGYNGGLGYSVTVSHMINGQRVDTIYGHMAAGSITVSHGQQISVGTHLGNVGSTGKSTGAHMHFEVHLDGVPVDGFAWVAENANVGDWTL